MERIIGVLAPHTSSKIVGILNRYFKTLLKGKRSRSTKIITVKTEREEREGMDNWNESSSVMSNMVVSIIINYIFKKIKNIRPGICFKC